MRKIVAGWRRSFTDRERDREREHERNGKSPIVALDDFELEE